MTCVTLHRKLPSRRHHNDACNEAPLPYLDDDGETTYETPTFLRFDLKYTFICVYWWTRQRIHNTLIVVDRYLRLMGDKTIPDSAEPRLESFYPPWVAGIDLPHQGVMDSYNPRWRHQMETFSASQALCQGNPPVAGGFPSQRPVTGSFDVFWSAHEQTVE